MLNRIYAFNWAPINYNSNIIVWLANLIYKIGTKAKINFREYIFDQTMKHADSFDVKLHIAFPCVITEVILHQHPNILKSKDVKSKKLAPPAFNYKLF